MTAKVPLARIEIAIADYLIPLTPEQRDDVIVRALCVVEDGSPAADTPIPYVPTERHPVTACDDVPEPVAQERPSRRRVAATRKAATAEIEAAARSIVEVLSGHTEGMTKGQLANALNMDVGGYRFKDALHHVVSSGRIRATGNTINRRYLPAAKKES